MGIHWEQQKDKKVPWWTSCFCIQWTSGVGVEDMQVCVLIGYDEAILEAANEMIENWQDFWKTSLTTRTSTCIFVWQLLIWAYNKP